MWPLSKNSKEIVTFINMRQNLYHFETGLTNALKKKDTFWLDFLDEAVQVFGTCAAGLLRTASHATMPTACIQARY